MKKSLAFTDRTKQLHLNTEEKLLNIVITKYLPLINSVISEYDLKRTSKFNIFETISDLYKRENFHSDILYTILSHDTAEIGYIHHTEILREFIKMIDTESNFIIDDTVEITKEKHNIVWDGTEKKEGYIDLLISNAHNQAIIIENKINDAPDQPNQLVRYMSYVTEQLFANKPVEITVVYLTLIPGKLPDFDKYDNYFSKYIEMIKDAKNGKDGKILKYRSAVDKDRNKGSLVKFLTNCQKFFIENDDKNIIKKVYLDQYKILLSHLGGKTAMLEYQKDLVRTIYSSQDNLEAAKNITEVFAADKKGENEIVNQYINDALKTLVEPLGLTFEDNWMYRVWDKKHKEYLYVLGQFRNFQIGFGTSSSISKQKQNEYKKLLEDTFKLKVKDYNETWVWLQIEPLAGKTNMEEFLKYCTSFIPRLTDKFLKK